MHQMLYEQLRTVAEAMDDGGLPNLGDDALIYAGSATWEDWRNHVPQIICSLWPAMGHHARLAVYVTAKQFTMYKARSETDVQAQT